MKARLTAILVHGLGGDPAWWQPLTGLLASLGIKPLALDMPSCQEHCPETWVNQVVQAASESPTILIGHSLGAAVCLEAARRCPVEGLVLCAMPWFAGERPPRVPEGTGLSLSALARVGLFLREASLRAPDVPVETLCYVGDSDPCCTDVSRQSLPFQVRVIPGADHDLAGSERFRTAFAGDAVRTGWARRRLDPAVRLRGLSGRKGWSLPELGLTETAPSPSRIDVEVTTRCQLSCVRCARTLYRLPSHPLDMDEPLFTSILASCPQAQKVFFVGLGEPLLHPELERFVELAAGCGLETGVVTNGLAATPQRLSQLAQAGLTGVTFSIDSSDPGEFARLRGGADLATVVAHLGGAPVSLARSVFATLSQDNAAALPGLTALVQQLGLPALALTDVNFRENQHRSLHAVAAEAQLANPIRTAYSEGIVLIGPHFHDLPDVRGSLHLCAIRRPGDLMGRASHHRHCLAPWRILVVGADGGISPCNCAPTIKMGKLGEGKLEEIWNGPEMQNWRRAMLENDNPHCRLCPRY